jgi:hypothetical protein
MRLPPTCQDEFSRLDATRETEPHWMASEKPVILLGPAIEDPSLNDADSSGKLH